MNIEPEVVPRSILQAPPPRRRRRWLRLLLMAVIFASGMFVGAAGTFLSLRKWMLDMIHHPERAPAKIAVNLGKQFGWSKPQVKQVEALLHTRQKNLSALRREVQPRVVAEIKQLEEEVAAVLDARQQKAWRAACEKQLRTWVPELSQPESPQPESPQPESSQPESPQPESPGEITQR